VPPAVRKESEGDGVTIKRNQKFGRLTTLRVVGVDKYHHKIWRCACSCGVIKDINASGLIHTRSCGCLRSETMAKNRKFRVYQRKEKTP
jgi:hypothetical protein